MSLACMYRVGVDMAGVYTRMHQDGRTALHLTVARNDMASTEALFSGASCIEEVLQAVCTPDRQGVTPLDLSQALVTKDRGRMFKFLKDRLQGQPLPTPSALTCRAQIFQVCPSQRRNQRQTSPTQPPNQPWSDQVVRLPPGPRACSHQCVRTH